MSLLPSLTRPSRLSRTLADVIRRGVDHPEAMALLIRQMGRMGDLTETEVSVLLAMLPAPVTPR